MRILEKTEIRFHAPRGGVRHLTWAQRLLWNDSQWLGADDHFYNVTVELPITVRRDRKEVLDVLTALVERHEALRTHYVVSADGDPLQEITREGSLPVEILSADAADLDAVSREWLDDRHDISFSFPAEWSSRLALVETSGVPRRTLMIISHLSFDAFAEIVLRADFQRFLDEGPSADFAGSPAYQPWDRARYEASEKGVRQSEKALRHWSRTLASAPSRMFAYEMQEPADPRYVRLSMQSDAVFKALDVLAARHGATSPSVLVAAAAALLSNLTGNETVLMKTISGNRFTADARNMVGVSVGNSIIALPVRGPDFAALVRDAAKASIIALMHAQCDPVKLYELRARVNDERGVHTDLFEAFINDRRQLGDSSGAGGAPDLRSLAKSTVVYRSGDWARQNAKIFLDVGPGDRGDVVNIMADTAFVPLKDIERLLRGLESLLITATERDVTLAEIPSITGITPRERGAVWRLVDGNWVDVALAERTVREATGTSSAALFVDESRGEAELVAYLHPKDPTQTPESVHRSVVDALEDRPFAMAPARYVVCAGAPDGPAPDEAAWRAQRVLRTGTGRAAEVPE